MVVTSSSQILTEGPRGEGRYWTCEIRQGFRNM